ncbi:tRNA pseudouridine(13) synthase TruD [Methanosalsum natronophilum]|uniref:Probable tRNA pseudouridine synthase D n=1 Tax=Methanosalsum natronophilum TaxID=768733 RepID=A0A424YLD8_9EURY|nr:tRNA pseudouridine(13) synthase TruD [Methanosalsum natronophilum]MCS3923186.1 tRNA pseudouridine13 synthase [Methanosalsum natronophilum]RQD79807.1 MAG: tRNA pseudouridine(13) synthase TruD [Methanosalsum natronophilum]
MKVYELEQKIGIECYFTTTSGTGGSLKQIIEDFEVNEVTNREEGKSGKYLILELKKHNWDTHHVIREISRRLRISQKRITFAGTKDKRAITTQKISISDLDASEIENINLKDIKLKVLGRSNRSVDLGDLIGNEFKITIRNIDLKEDELNTVLESITDEISESGGVPNYFGIQRFGSIRPITHLVGRELVKGDTESAALTYISKPFPNEPEDTVNARQFVADTMDFAQGLKTFPDHLRYERTMMHHLVTHPGDYEGAFLILPKNLRRMFIHAYQSYIYNKILSERIKQDLPFNRATVGDIVCFKNSDGFPDTSKTQKVTEKTIHGINNLLKRNRAFVTAPLIGSNTEFASETPGEIEQEIFKHTGTSQSNFANIPVEGLSSKGMRREILLQTIPKYEVDEDELNNGKLKVILNFKLPKGSYATTVLREYMKVNPLQMS